MRIKRGKACGGGETGSHASFKVQAVAKQESKLKETVWHIIFFNKIKKKRSLYTTRKKGAFYKDVCRVGERQADVCRVGM